MIFIYIEKVYYRVLGEVLWRCLEIKEVLIVYI